MTLSQVAASKNLTEAQFRTNLIAQLTPLLDAAVKANQLTSAQEQAVLQRLKTGTIPYWSTPMKHKPAAGATPAPATTQT